jgi:hypothetical protein
MADKLHLEPWQLAYDYMTRSGRLGDERLAAMAPAFMQRVAAGRARAPLDGSATRLPDPFDLASDAPREIDFALPERYNCSRILYDSLAPGRASKVAVLCGDRRCTYGELCALASRVGNGLAAMGLARASRVLMLMHDTPEYAAAIFGAIRAGFVPVLINTLSPAELVGFYLQDSGAEAAIVDGALARLLDHESVHASRLRHVVYVGRPQTAPDLGLARKHDWSQWIEQHSEVLAEADTHRDEMAFWMYSSGSTGRPKGVVHLQHDAPYTHRAYGAGVLGIRADDVVFSPPKIFFAYGFGNSLTFPFSVGATTVLLAGRPDPEAVPRSSGIARRSCSACRRCTRRWPRIRVLKRATCRACACASPPRRCWQATSTGNGSGATDCRSSRDSARPRCCISTCPTASTDRNPAPAGHASAATRSSSPISKAIRSRPASPGCCGCAGIRKHRATGIDPTRPRRPCARAGSTPATASGWTRTASISSRDAPTT